MVKKAVGRYGKTLPSKEELCRVLRYEPSTGKFFWKERTEDMFLPSFHPPERQCRKFNTRFAGKEAFTADSGNGYKCGFLFSKPVKAHRVAWKMSFGYDPIEVDHINGDRSDNRIANLREVTAFGNSKNRALQKNNTSGAHGVTWHKQHRKWYVRINDNGKEIFVGMFENVDQAIAARLEKQRELGYHNNHGRQAAGGWK